MMQGREGEVGACSPHNARTQSAHPSFGPKHITRAFGGGDGQFSQCGYAIKTRRGVVDEWTFSLSCPSSANIQSFCNPQERRWRSGGCVQLPLLAYGCARC